MKSGAGETPLTQEQTVRIECIRLAYRHDHEAQRIIDKASELEQYVMKGTPAGTSRKRSTSPGKA